MRKECHEHICELLVFLWRKRGFVCLLNCFQYNYFKGLEVVQLVKCLLYNHKDLKSNPQHPHKKLSMVACTCNFSDKKSETGISLELTNLTRLDGQWAPGSMRDFVSKVKSNSERYLWPPHTCTDTQHTQKFLLF